MANVNACKHWFFTWNNYCANAADLLKKTLLPLAERLHFQSEVGEETHTPHIQGCVTLKVKGRWSEFGLPKQIQWKVTKKVDHAEIYCNKDHTYDGKFRFAYPIDKLAALREAHCNEHALSPYQEFIEQMLDTKADDRKIYWFWEPTGNVGKSWFAKYMYLKYGERIGITSSSRSSDIVTIADESIEMYVFDFPRCMRDFAPYQALEQLKNGLVSDGKLKKKMITKVFPRPHIVCFANSPPPENGEAMSKDKWAVLQIGVDIMHLAPLVADI